MIDPSKIEELKAANPGMKLHKLRQEDDEVIVRSPTPAIYRKCKAKSRDEKTNLDANEIFVRDCLVYPDPQGFTAMLNDRPGLADTFANQLMEIAGGAKECEVVPL